WMNERLAGIFEGLDHAQAWPCVWSPGFSRPSAAVESGSKHCVGFMPSRILPAKAGTPNTAPQFRRTNPQIQQSTNPLIHCVQDSGSVPYVIGSSSRPPSVVTLRVFSSIKQATFSRSDLSASEITVWTLTARSILAFGCLLARMESNQFFSCTARSSMGLH